MKTKSLLLIFVTFFSICINSIAQTVTDMGNRIYINGNVSTGNYKNFYLKKDKIQSFFVNGNYLVIDIDDKAGTNTSISRPIQLDYREVNGGFANISSLRSWFFNVLTSHDFGSVKIEKTYTFLFSNDTMTFSESDGYYGLAFQAGPNNSGRIWAEGLKRTIDGIESQPIFFESGDSYGDGMGINIIDSITVWSNYVADTVKLSVKCK